MPTAELTSIAVIVVNYGTYQLALQAVQSVLDQPNRGHRVHVHLVDNHSPKGDAAALARAMADRGWQDRVTFWPEAVNHGFGRGNNVVIHALMRGENAPDYVMLLNPDAQVANDAVGLLADYLDDHPQVGAVGASVLDPDGQPVAAAFRFPSVLSELITAINLGVLSRLFRHALVPLPADQPRGPVDWVTGAAVMFRMERLRALDGFDPDFFLYFEEVELMHRITRSGAEVHYNPEARVTHVEGAATEVKGTTVQRKAKPGYWYRSWRLYHLKTRGRAGALLAAAAWMVGAAINWTLSRLRGRSPLMPLNFYRDFWRAVVWPLLVGRDVDHV